MKGLKVAGDKLRLLSENSHQQAAPPNFDNTPSVLISFFLLCPSFTKKRTLETFNRQILFVTNFSLKYLNMVIKAKKIEGL